MCVCTNQACTDEGQMMMMMVVVVDLPDGYCRYNVREKNEERKENKKIEDKWIFE
jgi:hypothetical protein